jgi:hypothetical protein
MARLQNSTTALSTQAHAAFQRHCPAPGDKDIREAEDRVRQQEAHVLRLIVQGAPTQSAEDLLRELTAAVEAMRAQRRVAHR